MCTYQYKQIFCSCMKNTCFYTSCTADQLVKTHHRFQYFETSTEIPIFVCSTPCQQPCNRNTTQLLFFYLGWILACPIEKLLSPAQERTILIWIATSAEVLMDIRQVGEAEALFGLSTPQIVSRYVMLIMTVLGKEPRREGRKYEKKRKANMRHVLIASDEG